MRVACLCCLHLRCALGFVEDSAHGRTGPTMITCPNPASHSGRQHVTLCPLVAQLRITLNASSLSDRIIVTGRVFQARIRFSKATTAQEVVDLTRGGTTRGEADADEDGRGASDPQHTYECHVGGVVRTRTHVRGWPSRPGQSIQGAHRSLPRGRVMPARKGWGS